MQLAAYCCVPPTRIEALAGVTVMLVNVIGVNVAVTVQAEAGIVPESTLPDTVPPQVSASSARKLPEFAFAVQDQAVPAVYVPAQLEPVKVPDPEPAVAAVSVNDGTPV